MRFSPFAPSSAGVGWRRCRRLALPLRLAALYAALPLLAAVLALAASGGAPGGGSPVADTPAAEAVGRSYYEVLPRDRFAPYALNASDVPDDALDEGGRSGYGGLTLHGGIINPGRCEIDINPSGGGPIRDLYCVSYTERALVTIKNSGASVPYRAYHSGGRAGVGNAYHHDVQIVGEDFNGNNLKMGRAGLAEYNGVLAENGSRTITLDRSMARTHAHGGATYYTAGRDPLRNDTYGAVYLVIYPGADNQPLNSLLPQVADGNLNDATTDVHPIIKLYFVLDYNPNFSTMRFVGVDQDNGPIPFTDSLGTGVLTSGPTGQIIVGDSGRPSPYAQPNSPAYRVFDLTGYWITDEDLRAYYYAPPRGSRPYWNFFHIHNDGNGLEAENTGITWCFTAYDYAGGPYWHPGAYAEARMNFAPGTKLAGSGEYVARARTALDHFRLQCTFEYLNGFDPAGPMRGELAITYHDGKGGSFPFEPVTLLVQGPPTGITVTSRPEMSISSRGARSVRIEYAVMDGAGNTLSDGDMTGTPTHINYVGADDASIAVIDRRDGAGNARGGALTIPIKADAPAGTYRVKLSSASNARVDRTVAFTIYDLPGAVSGPAPAAIAPVVSGSLRPGGRVNIRYTLADADGNLLNLRRNPVTWTAADDATRAVIAAAGSVDSARQSDGSFSFDLADGAAPGDYAVIVSTVATDNGSPLATARATFRILGDPARYTLAGADRVAPGGYATYTVTAADANGNLPFLGGQRSAVTVTLAGAGAGSVRLFHLTDDVITLNREGSGRFRLRVNSGASAGSVTLTVASADGGVTAEKVVAIGGAVP